MRVAVVGLGRMGRFYAHTLAALGPAVQLAAVVDSDPLARGAIRAELSAPVAFADLKTALESSEIDAVVVATPTSSHAEVVIEAARAGKAIFCEKPLALSLEQTLAALAAVERAGVLMQVGFMRRFDPAYVQAKAFVESGRIGRPTTFKSVGRDPTCPPTDFANPASSGGLVLDMAIHDFDLARWLMSSEVERVSAEGTLLACADLASVGDIDNAVINLRFTNGAIGNVEVSRNARYGYDIRTEVLGSEGAVSVGSLGDPVSLGGAQLLAASPAPLADVTPHFLQRFGVAYRAQIEHFVACVKHDRQPGVTGADALAAFEIAAGATESWQTGRPIQLAGLHV